MDLLRSPLHDHHVALGAKMAEFGGWSMPLEYPSESGGGVLAEHAAVREAAGLFDVSHLGKASVRGAGAVDHVNAHLTNDLRRIRPGQAQYTLCCDEDGGTVDDLIAYVRSDFDVFLVPNAANTAAVVERLRTLRGGSLRASDAFGVLLPLDELQLLPPHHLQLLLLGNYCFSELTLPFHHC